MLAKLLVLGKIILKSPQQPCFELSLVISFEYECFIRVRVANNRLALLTLFVVHLLTQFILYLYLLPINNDCLISLTTLCFINTQSAQQPQQHPNSFNTFRLRDPLESPVQNSIA